MLHEPVSVGDIVLASYRDQRYYTTVESVDTYIKTVDHRLYYLNGMQVGLPPYTIGWELSNIRLDDLTSLVLTKKIDIQKYAKLLTGEEWLK